MFTECQATAGYPRLPLSPALTSRLDLDGHGHLKYDAAFSLAPHCLHTLFTYM